uniref:Major facilitator superfamily (MFS) profile domain-containing protein n=1 Tax=Panagrolaimus sp. ES5 TaxID=591445 RepID=A0AC34FQ48_9BILA
SETELQDGNDDTPVPCPLYSAPIIYSEPILQDAQIIRSGYTNYVLTGALSETALPLIYQHQQQLEQEQQQQEQNHQQGDDTQSMQSFYVPSGKKFSVSRNYTPKSSMFFSDSQSQRSILTNMGSTSETELQNGNDDTPVPCPLYSAPIIYSEPILQDAQIIRSGYTNYVLTGALSETALPLVNSQSQRSILTNMGSTVFGQHKQSFSTREIREQHAQIQKKYRPEKQKKFTDPIDFEGILQIIGGCTWWQIWVYLLISFQQIPHAMFNLSVVYMMYQPDHWCQVPQFMNDTSINGTQYLWNFRDAMNYSIVYPNTGNKQRDVLDFHDQFCDDNFKRGHAHLSYSVGFLFGCLLGGFASDRFGRKPTIIGFGILSSMFGLILPYSTYFPLFLFIRFCGAVCNEAADLAAYILCMEITGTHYRAMVGSLLQAPWAVGYALLALIAYFCKSWHYIQLITALLHTGSICLICVLPESPRWLIVNDRLVEAERYIRKACREPPFPFSYFHFNKSSLPCDLELKRHSERAKWIKENQRANMFHIFKSRPLLLRTIIICTVWIATALVYYGLVIALSDQSAPGRVLFSGNFFVNNAVAGAIEIPTLFGCVYLMKYGRKRSQMITLIGAAICILFAMAAINSKSQALSLIFMLLSKIFIQGAFNVLYIFTSEMYPTIIRNSAVGFNSMIARFGSGVSSYIAILSDVTLAIVPMIIFAIFSLFAGALVLLLPETQDQPLPDTFQDAVQLIREKNPFQCYGFGFNKYSFSIAGDLEKPESVTDGGIVTRTNSRLDDDENSITPALNDSTSVLSRRRSETFTELPVIFEQPSSAENTITSQNRPEALRTLSLGMKDDKPQAFTAANGGDESEPRKRKRGVIGSRKTSLQSKMSKGESLLRDLAEIEMPDPDKMDEPFD